MATAKKESLASKEGFVVISDADLLAGTENRVRQLESELASHTLLLAEAQADTTDSTSEEAHAKAIESLEKRLAVSRERLAAIRAHVEASKPAEAAKATEPPKP